MAEEITPNPNSLEHRLQLKRWADLNLLIQPENNPVYIQARNLTKEKLNEIGLGDILETFHRQDDMEEMTKRIINRGINDPSIKKKLFKYTQGVISALVPAINQYGEEAVLKLISDSFEKTEAEEILNSLEKAVNYYLENNNTPTINITPEDRPIQPERDLSQGTGIWDRRTKLFRDAERSEIISKYVRKGLIIGVPSLLIAGLIYGGSQLISINPESSDKPAITLSVEKEPSKPPIELSLPTIEAKPEETITAESVSGRGGVTEPEAKPVQVINQKPITEPVSETREVIEPVAEPVQVINPKPITEPVSETGGAKGPVSESKVLIAPNSIFYSFTDSGGKQKLEIRKVGDNSYQLFREGFSQGLPLTIVPNIVEAYIREADGTCTPFNQIFKMGSDIERYSLFGPKPQEVYKNLERKLNAYSEVCD